MKMFRATTRAHCLLMLAIFYNAIPSRASEGSAFYLAFMKHSDISYTEPNISISISNPSNTLVEYDFHLSGERKAYFTGALNPMVTVHHSLPSSLVLQDSGKSPHNIYIHSMDNKPLIVQAYSALGNNTSAWFSVLPKPLMTRDFIAATHCENNDCALIVTTSEDTNDIIITVRTDGQAQYGESFYVDGQQIEERLSVGESMQVLCYGCDLTGSLMHARSEAAVFGGGMITRQGYPDQAVAEQMMPLETLGCWYPLPATSNRYSELIKVVPLLAGDTFLYDEVLYKASVDREVFTFTRLTHTSPVEIVADSQVLVVQILQMVLSSTGKVAMHLPLPAFLWQMDYNIYVPYPLSYLRLLMPIGSAKHLRTSFNTKTVRTDLNGIYNTTILRTESTGMLHVYCDDYNSTCEPFWGFLYHSNGTSSASLTMRCTVSFFSESIVCELPSSSPTTAVALTTTASFSSDSTTTTVTTTAIDIPMYPNTSSTTTASAPLSGHHHSFYDTKPCSCVLKASDTQRTLDEQALLAEQARQSIMEELMQDKKLLSSYTRTKQSASDDRVSSSYLATTVGTVCIAVAAVTVVLPDLINAVKFILRCND